MEAQKQEGALHKAGSQVYPMTVVISVMIRPSMVRAAEEERNGASIVLAIRLILLGELCIRGK